MRAEGGFIRVAGLLEKADRFRQGAVMGALSGIPTSGQVDEPISGVVQKEPSMILHAVEHSRIFEQPAPEILEPIAGVGLRARNLEQEREQGIAVFFEDLFQVVHAGFRCRTHRPRAFVYRG